MLKLSQFTSLVLVSKSQQFRNSLSELNNLPCCLEIYIFFSPTMPVTFLGKKKTSLFFFFQFSYLLSIQVTNYLKSTKQNLIIGPIPIWATEECNHGNLAFRADHLMYLSEFKYLRMYPFLSRIMPGTFCSSL